MSHDRAFLDAICTHILHVEARRPQSGSLMIGIVGLVARLSRHYTPRALQNELTAGQLASGGTVLNGPFAIWITQAFPTAGAGTIYTSTQSTGFGTIGSGNPSAHQQFAVFTNGTGLGGLGAISIDAFGAVINSTDPAARFFVGMENNVNGGRGFGTAAGVPVSDRDYNDFTISVQSVPEPATLGLMGVGLLALAGIAAKRRKSQASH